MTKADKVEVDLESGAAAVRRYDGAATHCSPLLTDRPIYSARRTVTCRRVLDCERSRIQKGMKYQRRGSGGCLGSRVQGFRGRRWRWGKGRKKSRVVCW